MWWVGSDNFSIYKRIERSQLKEHHSPTIGKVSSIKFQFRRDLHNRSLDVLSLYHLRYGFLWATHNTRKRLGRARR